MNLNLFQKLFRVIHSKSSAIKLFFQRLKRSFLWSLFLIRKKLALQLPGFPFLPRLVIEGQQFKCQFKTVKIFAICVKNQSTINFKS
jgi:hypothetical protein